MSVIAPPYLRQADLSAKMLRRPASPFFLTSYDYRVIDGDTFAVLAPKNAEGKRVEAFRIRLNSVNAPEKPTPVPDEAILLKMGYDPYSGHPGTEATKAVKKLMQKRAIFVEPIAPRRGYNTDRYGRLLGTVTVSGAVGKFFDCHNAIPLEPWLIRTGHGHQMNGRPSPAGLSPIISRLEQELLNQFEYGKGLEMRGIVEDYRRIKVAEEKQRAYDEEYPGGLPRV